MKQNMFAITDIEGYAVDMREAAAKEITSYSFKDLDQYVSLGQVNKIIDEYSEGYDALDRVIISEDSHVKIYDDIVQMLYTTSLAKMASNGEIECAWNSDTNEMEFWTQ